MKLKYSIIFSLLLVTVLALTGGCNASSLLQPKAVIFDNLDEMHCLDDYVTGTEPIADKNIEGLEVIDQYCAVVNYNGSLYTVRAYEFKDVETAKLYFKRGTGKDSGAWDSNFSQASNFLLHTRCVVFLKNRILYVEGGALKPFGEFKNFLFDQLSVSLTG